jgi:hypothetical protein
MQGKNHQNVLELFSQIQMTFYNGNSDFKKKSSYFNIEFFVFFLLLVELVETASYLSLYWKEKKINKKKRKISRQFYPCCVYCAYLYFYDVYFCISRYFSFIVLLPKELLSNISASIFSR